MRRLAAALGIVALAGTGAIGLSQEPPRPLVILVHGRGQNGQDSAALRREWKSDLDSSLALVGVPRLPDEDVRLVWYADVMDAESDNDCRHASAVSDSLTFGDVARGFVGFIASLAGPDDSRDVRGLMGDVLFLVDPSIRCAAEIRVGRAIEAAAREHRPVIVIAYSLGSLVTHGYLSSRDTSGTTPLRLITVGSPLGIRPIRELVFGADVDSLRPAAGVSEWDNVYDPGDVLSAPLDGAIPRRTIRDHSADTAADDPHNFRHYLRDRQTGEALKRALCALRPGCRAPEH
ncbi:MAG TPA: hypothetical protein VFT29_16845 [Gemmatimonadaceae bacterium]|nr:hypothetical protein [Gemmatimonadaceae bacterium]